MAIAQQGPLEIAKSAFARHSWAEAYERFAEADRTSALPATELEAYAEAAWWSGHPVERIALDERAYAEYVEKGEHRLAARMAFELVRHNALRGMYEIAAAWLARSERLLEGDPEASEYAYVWLARAGSALNGGNIELVLDMTRRSLEIASRAGDRDAQAYALVMQGRAHLAIGNVREGMALIDEATVAAVSGELGLFATGVVYCGTISACRDLADYRRASEWTEAAHRWCERQSVSGFPGVCRVHRAEIMALRGTWAEAEQEARRACDELQRFQLIPDAADGYYEIGEIRLRMGDLPAAEEAFRQAHEMGRTPEPGLSLLRLEQEKAPAANAALKRALAEEQQRPTRARILPAQVLAAIASEDLETARAATAELQEIATLFGSKALEASARSARGALELAEGDAAAADRSLRSSLQLWQEVGAPYEAARTRVAIAAAARQLGDEESGNLELRAAKATFERIGAARETRRVRDLLGEAADGVAPAVAASRVTKTFLFTDIVRSTDLIGAIGDDAWKDLIRWHDDALRSLVAEHEGEEIRHQGDGLVVAFDSPAQAISCAIAIQRRLAEHRRKEGFSPRVRIGMHATEAIRRGLDYAGVGVHAAARIGALAAGGEILVSASTLRSSRQAFAAGAARRVMLKGIAQPVEVVPILWE